MKPTYAKKEDIPKGLEAFYAEKDGVWVLQVEGLVPAADLTAANTRLDEFRSNNISLTQKLKEFEGKTVLTQEEQEQYDALKATAQDIEDKNLIDAGKIDELVATRTQRLQADFDSKEKRYKEELEKAQASGANFESRLAGVLVEAEVGKILSLTGVTPVQGALPDITARARKTWKVDDKGELVALDSNGNPVYGTDPSKPLSMEEWAAQTVKDAPYFFGKSTGTGGEGNDEGAAKNTDGILQIPRSNEALKSKHIEDIASGKAVVVD